MISVMFEWQLDGQTGLVWLFTGTGNGCHIHYFRL